MNTIGQLVDESKKTCTAFELSEALDKLRSKDGSVDQAKLEKLIIQLKDFGPVYKNILETIVSNLE